MGKKPYAKNYKRMVELVRPYWRQLVFAMICMMGVGWTTAAGAYLIKDVLDGIFINKRQDLLLILPLAVLALFTAKGLCMWGNVYLTSRVSNKIVTEIRQQLYDHMQTLSMSFYDKNSTGDLISRVVNDVMFLQSTASSAVVGILRESFSIVSLLVVVFYRDWQLAIIALVVLPLGFFPVIKLSRKLRGIGVSGQASLADITVILHETISGSRIVKAFGMEEYEKGRFAKLNEKFLNLMMKMIAVTALSSPIMEVIAGLVIVFTIWYGGTRVVNGTDTAGNFFSFTAAVLLLYEPAKRLNNTVGVLPLGLAAADRIYDILDLKPEITDKPGATDLAPIQHSIEFKNVSFHYDKETVLHDINITARVGEVIALVGMSGAGKTTLVNLIPRFYDVSEGAVLVDGVDIRDVTVSSLRSQIGMVTQQSILFNDTVRANIAYGDINRSEEDLILAAKAANAYDFIMRMPEGFDSPIGEAGVKLSGGERQRICIARALLKDAPILILDEATSSLDSDSEMEVQNALDNLMVGRTTFVIAHRLSTIKNADRIIAMSNGRIVEVGRHEELLKTGQEYRRLYDLQFAGLQAVPSGSGNGEAINRKAS